MGKLLVSWFTVLEPSITEPACLELVAEGIRIGDLGGQASTSGFTDEVIRRIQLKRQLVGATVTVW